MQQDQSFWSGRDQVQPTVIVEIKEHGVEHIPGSRVDRPSIACERSRPIVAVEVAREEIQKAVVVVVAGRDDAGSARAREAAVLGDVLEPPFFEAAV